jgi:outer membrane protein W
MKRHAFLLIAFASLLIMAASANAETSYRFELYGSATIPIDKDFEIGLPQSTVPLDGEFEVSPGVRGGVRFGVDGLGHWGQDMWYSYGTNASKIVVDQNGDFSFMSRSHQFAYNVLLYPGGLSPKKFNPYVTAGAGGTIFTLSQKSVNEGMNAGLGKLETHTSFTFNAGAGFFYRIKDSCSIRVDVRDHMSHPPRYGMLESSDDPAVSVFPVKGIFHQFEVSFALVFPFGK